jgi:hypothetical protein
MGSEQLPPEERVRLEYESSPWPSNFVLKSVLFMQRVRVHFIYSHSNRGCHCYRGSSRKQKQRPSHRIGSLQLKFFECLGPQLDYLSRCTQPVPKTSYPLLGTTP